jgi:hypothetical protein
VSETIRSQTPSECEAFSRKLVEETGTESDPCCPQVARGRMPLTGLGARPYGLPCCRVCFSVTGRQFLLALRRAQGKMPEARKRAHLKKLFEDVMTGQFEERLVIAVRFFIRRDASSESDRPGPRLTE